MYQNQNLVSVLRLAHTTVDYSQQLGQVASSVYTKGADAQGQ